ncbi:MAG: 3'-5' exonuclease [Elusimicrobiota bacterium]
MLNHAVRDVTFALLDTETTGLSARRGARVCELAVLTVRGGSRPSLFQTLIDPRRPIEPGARMIHGITDAMVAGSPTFESLAPRIVRLLEGTVLVCHNAPFDISFMESEFERAGLPMPSVPVIDTLRLARRHFNFESNSLGRIADAIGVEPDGWHRAGSDVKILHGVFEHFLKELPQRGVETLEDMLAR